MLQGGDGSAIAGLRGLHETGKQFAVALLVHRKSRSLRPHPLTGAMDHLPAIGLAMADQLGDLHVVEVERLLEQERGALLRPESLQQGQQRQRDVLGALVPVLRIGVLGNVQRLGKPGAGVGPADGTRRAQPVQAQAGGGGDQPGFRIVDSGALVAGMPAKPGVLHHFLGVAAGPQQPVGQAEQAWTMLLENNVGFHVIQDVPGRAGVTGPAGGRIALK